MKPCGKVRSVRRGYWEGTLDPREEKRVDRHLLRCGKCWEHFHAGDPIRIFSRLEEPRREDAFWRGFWPAVRERIEGDRGAAAPLWVPLRPLPWIAAPAIALVLLAGGWFLRTGLLPSGGPPELGRGVPPPPPAAALRRAAVRMPTIETLPSPNSRVYEFHLGDPGEETTEILLIFDESIDL